MTEVPEPDTRWVTPKNLTEEQIAEARRALDNLIRLMARAAVDASIRLGVEFDVDDPEVARDVMKATFEGLFLAPSHPAAGKRSARKRTAR
ncbi:MAG TPA: hypothetical protein VGB04_02425 [Allosphingosinicella sp.]|jgi:hypothetical protein